MKIKITMKDPDGVWEGVLAAVREADTDLTYQEACDDANDIMQTDRFKQVFLWGEYLDVVYDTDTGEVEVIYNT